MFANNSYAKVWKIEPKDKPEQKYTVVQLSTSKKNKQTNKYETDFSGYARLIGEAEKKASSIEAKDSIKLINVGVTTNYNAETRKSFTQFLVFDFETTEKKNSSEGEWVNTDDIKDEDLPFAD